MLLIQVLALLAFAPAAGAEDAMSFRLAASRGCGGGSCPQVIAAEGEITNRTPADFVDFFRQNLSGSSSGVLVLINSPGGKVVAAMELGKAFRRMGAAAMVGRVDNGGHRFAGGSCFSACVYALMGAKKRIVPRNSKVALHRMFAYESGDPSGFAGPRQRRFDDGRMAAALQRYAAAMGVSPDLVRAAEHGSSDGPRMLSPMEIAKWRLGAPKL